MKLRESAGSRHRSSVPAPPLRPEIVLVAVLVFSGILVAIAWRALAPTIAGWSEMDEQAIAVDGTLVLVGVVAGIATAAGVLLRPGARPTTRALAAIIGSAGGAALAWWLGDLIGTPALGAVSAAAAWPIATSAGLFLGAVLPVTSRRIDQSEAAALEVRIGRSEPSGLP